MTIAIIGAGLAGLACARALTAAGRAVRLFDKGRGPGGRVATRPLEVAGTRLQFDHGAQYVSAHGAGFAAALAAAPMARWPNEDRLVAVPGMSALPRSLAAGLDIAIGCEITAIMGEPGAWHLHQGAAPAEFGPFETVLITAPPVQTARLLAGPAPNLAATLKDVDIAPCWTALVAFAAPTALPDTLRPEGGAIGWAARDSAKPGRDAGTECWVVQGNADWSRTHLEATPQEAANALREALAALAPAPLPATVHLAGHRWRYAAVARPLGEPCHWDATLRLGFAGDWCLAARAEAAFDSGAALAAAVLR